MVDCPHPKRGEVWWVRPGKTAGAELQKKCPYVVNSADAIGNGLPLHGTCLVSCNRVP